MAAGKLPFLQRLAELAEDVTQDKSSHKTFRLKVKEVASNDSKRITKYDLVTNNEYWYEAPEKVVLVVGPTGSGKTTLINAIANYVLGVEFEDDKRFILVREEQTTSQTKSQTESITSYTMHHEAEFKIPYTLTLVDTPGYGDTRGLEWDKKNTENIKELFSAKGKPYAIDSISAILFVVKSSDVRLGESEKYIYQSILNLFGKDMESNLFPIFTFSDSEKPMALVAAREVGIPCVPYYSINNGTVFSESSSIKKKKKALAAWEDWEEDLETLLAALSSTRNMSLILTNEVLEERERLQCQIEGLKNKVLKHVVLLGNIQAKKKSIQHDITMTMLVEHHVKNQKGFHTYICRVCRTNCHKICKVPIDLFGRLCCVIKHGKCVVCNCGHDKHKVVTYHFNSTIETKKERASDVPGEMQNIDITSYDQARRATCRYVEEISEILQRLNEIALRPVAFSSKDYIAVLIKHEEDRCEYGWEDRVKELKEIRETEGLTDFFVKKHIETRL